MAVTSTRKVVVTFTGDVEFAEEFPAASNVVAPGIVNLVSLASGFNSIAVPVFGSVVPKALTIVPPSGNSQSIVLKGITGDTGLRLHDTDPSTISLHSSVTTVGLTAGAQINGVQLIWS